MHEYVTYVICHLPHAACTWFRFDSCCFFCYGCAFPHFALGSCAFLFIVAVHAVVASSSSTPLCQPLCNLYPLQMITPFVVAFTFKHCTVFYLALRKSGAVGQFHIPISNKLMTLERQVATQQVLATHSVTRSLTRVHWPYCCCWRIYICKCNICMSMLPQASEIGTTVMNKWNYVLI